MKQAPDTLYIITVSPERGEEIKRTLVLRGFDEVLCVPYDGARILLESNPPALAIIDLEGDARKVNALASGMPRGIKSLILAEAFDERLFVLCHDHGARDYMIKPVPDSYLVSRVIRTLQEHRLEQLVSQKDRILVEMGALSVRSGVFTTSYILKLLKKFSEEVSPFSPNPLSLMLIQLTGYTSPLPEELQNPLMADVAKILRECSRGQDAVGEYFMDKFAIILPHTGMRGVKSLAKRIEERLNGLEFQGTEGPQPLQIQIGMAEYSGCRHYEDLLNKAQIALHGQASSSGKTST